MRLLGGVPITGRVRETPQGGEARKKLNSSARHHDVPSTAIREEVTSRKNPTRWGMGDGAFAGYPLDIKCARIGK